MGGGPETLSPVLPAGESVFLAPGPVPAAVWWVWAGEGSAAVPSQPRAGLGFWACSLVASVVGFSQPFAPKPRHPHSHPGQVALFPFPSATTYLLPERLAQKQRGKRQRSESVAGKGNPGNK